MDAAPSFAEFEAEALRDGYDEVVERRWDPGAIVPTHAHPFALTLRLQDGEMWLRVGDDLRHLRPGDHCLLDADVPHDERYGPQGATVWVARRHRAG